MSSPSAAPSNSILVVGEPRVGKRFLVRRIVDSRSDAAAAAAKAAGDSTAAAAPAAAAVDRSAHAHIEQYRCAVDTKYYTADLTFHVLPANTHAALGASAVESAEGASDDAAAAELSAEARAEFAALDVQALVLVFDLSAPASFHALASSSWLPFLRDRAPGVLLIVGNNVAPPKAVADPAVAAAASKEREELELLVKDWALDNGLEYVRLPHNDTLSSGPSTSLGTPSVAASARSDGGTGRSGGIGLENDDDDASSDVELDPSAEPTGLSRLLEALECNLWTTLTLKDKKTLKYLSGPKETQPSEHDDVDGDESESAFRDMQQEHKHATARDTADGEHKSEGDGEGEEKFEQFVSAFPFVAESKAAAAAPAAASNGTAAAAAPSASAAAAPVQVAVASMPKSSTASSDAASRNAFANAFARAIRTDDAPAPSSAAAAAKSKAPAGAKKAAAPAAAPAASPSVNAAPASSAAAASSLEAPLTPSEMDAMTSQLLAAQAAAEASHAEQHGATDVSTDGSESSGDRKLESDLVAFDAVFDKISSIKADAMRARAAGADGTASLTDAERRKRAEDTVMQLLKSMGMEDEMGGSGSDDEQERGD